MTCNAEYLRPPTVNNDWFSSISFSFTEEFDHRRIAMIEEETLARIKRGNRFHVSSVEFKADDIEILGHSLLTNGLWNDDDPPLRQPSQNDLRDTLAVLGTDGSEDFVVKDI